MNRKWFRRRGWVHLPVSWQGMLIDLLALAFCAQVFCAVDRKSHSVSDTFYGVFPFFICCFLLLEWVGDRSSYETD